MDDSTNVCDVPSTDSQKPSTNSQPLSNLPQDPSSSGQPTQASADTRVSNAEQLDAAQNGTVETYSEKPKKTRVSRKDKRRLHTTRHAVLSRHPLEALARLGENLKSLRRIERKFRAELRPSGVMGGFWFDRFWSCYLRCLLMAKLEGTAVAPTDQPAGQPPHTPSVKEGDLPILSWEQSGMSGAALPADLLSHLTRVARYDKHFSKEMYRALAMLLVSRSGGEADLEECIRAMLGLRTEDPAEG